MMRVLVFTSLYPSAATPNHGVFVENRTRRLAESGAAEVLVVAPILLPPPPLDRHPRYAALREVPAVETRHGLTVHHPRVWMLPGIGWRFNPAMMTLRLEGFLRQLRAAFPFDVIDAHYFFPDGVAAARLGNRLGVPVVITARGSDINLWPKRPAARRMVLEAGARAAGIASVADGLAREMVALGMDAGKLRVLRNGVDLDHFHPMDRAECRARWAVTGPTLLSVGALIPIKGHDLTIRALRELPGVSLMIAGKGDQRSALEALAAELGVADRVRFLGPVPHGDLASLYNAADVQVHASRFEGLANVLLEAIACGTPLVATATSGTPEVLEDPAAGTLVPIDDLAALTGAIRQMVEQGPGREAVRRSAERFDWAKTTASQLEQFKLATRQL